MPSREEIELLRLHVELGVDEMVEEHPADFAVEPVKSKRTKNLDKMVEPAAKVEVVESAKVPIVQMPTSNRLSSPVEAIATAKQLADEIQDLAKLAQAVKEFDGCNLKKLATNTVFSDGDPKADLVIIGEAPGNNEDLTGVPFCGMSGELLNSMLESIGLQRQQVYITNVVFWRPPGNRRPTDEELEICRPLVERHIQLLNPKVIMLMGATSMFSLLRETRGITKIHGTIYEYTNDYMTHAIPTIPLYHPSYLMRQPKRKKEAWYDLLKVDELIKSA